MRREFPCSCGSREFASAKLRRLYGALEKQYPRVNAVYYFDVDNISAFNPARRVNDYSITGEPALLEAYKEATASDYYARARAEASMRWRAGASTSCPSPGTTRAC